MQHTRVKKLRGGKRYYSRLRDKARTFTLDLRPGHWYDLWHEHFDRLGHSRRDGRVRATHLSALFTAFRRVIAQVASTTEPMQVFVSIAPASEAEQDALYVHSPNPNGTLFPHPFEGVRWDASPPSLVRRFVENESWQVGVVTAADGQQWWVVRPFADRVRLPHMADTAPQ
jgi:hypothetical protein